MRLRRVSRCLSLLLLLMLPMSAAAQGISYGVKGGINFASVSVDPSGWGGHHRAVHCESAHLSTEPETDDRHCIRTLERHTDAPRDRRRSPAAAASRVVGAARDDACARGRLP